MENILVNTMRLLLSLFIIAFIIGCEEGGDAAKETGRWYTQSQLDKGRIIFKNYCGRCHGNNAQGTLKWKQTLPDGSYPPPPLNGSAHTWHHPVSTLKRTIRKGGVYLGGTMPAFKDELSDEDMDTVIAFFQSKWDKKIYDAWLKRDGLK